MRRPKGLKPDEPPLTTATIRRYEPAWGTTLIIEALSAYWYLGELRNKLQRNLNQDSNHFYTKMHTWECPVHKGCYLSVPQYFKMSLQHSRQAVIDVAVLVIHRYGDVDHIAKASPRTVNVCIQPPAAGATRAHQTFINMSSWEKELSNEGPSDAKHQSI